MNEIASRSQGDTVAGQSTVMIDDEQPRFTRRETLTTMAGVLMVMLLASLDQTIVSTAMPRVVADLNGYDRFTWVSTSYLLASTVMVPIYGKLSDIFGRKPIFLVGLTIFLAGSALSGVSQTMNELIAFRAFQGLGAAALMPIAIAVVGDLFTPRERGKWQGLTGAVFGLSSIVGPLAGGWITENISWRWVFYVNLPIGILAMLTLIFLMPTLRGAAREVKIDYLGAGLLVLGSVPLMLGFTWAGSTYAWTSPVVIGTFAVALLGLLAFFFYEAYLERKGGQPIIEPSLFKNRVFAISALVTMIFGMGLFGSIFFIPLFVQGVIGTSVTNSGLLLTPLMLASVVTSIISGQLVSRFGRYKWIAIVGMLLSIGGTGLLLRLGLHSTNNDVLLAMLVFGFGLGFSMSLYTLIVQNALPNSKIGQGTSALVFFRSIGGTIALAAMGSVLNTSYLPAFQSALPASIKAAAPQKFLAIFNNPQILLNPAALKAVQDAVNKQGPQAQAMLATILSAVKEGLVAGVHNVFLLTFIILLLGLVVLMFLKEIPLRDGKRQAPTLSEAMGESVPESETEAVIQA